MAVKPIPEGYHTITPCLIVEGANKLIEFVENTFEGKVSTKMQNDNGIIAHAELKIGDSMLMLAEATEEWKATKTLLYLYVENADATFQKALDAGATSVKEPADQFYGDRSATVKDAFGNLWSIATHIEDVADEEVRKRAEAYHLATN